MSADFSKLEEESQVILSRIVDLCERRETILRLNKSLVVGCFHSFPENFEVWTIQTVEDLIKQLRGVVQDLGKLRRRVLEKEGVLPLGRALELEYLRKCELLEALRSPGELTPAESVSFYREFSNSWGFGSTPLLQVNSEQTRGNT